jgi:hypothetical protein
MSWREMTPEIAPITRRVKVHAVHEGRPLCPYGRRKRNARVSEDPARVSCKACHEALERRTR